MTDAAEEEPKNVLDFKLHKEPGYMDLRRTNYGVDCEHRQLMLDYDNRTVICKTCNKLLDPYRALKIVQGWMAEKNYKYEAIQEYEKKQVEKRKKDQERRQAAINKQQAPEPTPSDSSSSPSSQPSHTPSPA